VSKPEKPKVEDLAAEVAAWNAYREIRQAHGLDVVRLFARISDEVRQGLLSPGARENFANLRNAGCLPEGLAALVLFLRKAPTLEKFWNVMVGNPENRRIAMESLENAAQTLEALHADAPNYGTAAEDEQFARLERIPISRLVAELRLHVKLINIAQLIKNDTEARTPTEVARYLRTGYVRGMTGRFHDESVSGLVGEISMEADDYNEVAQRMWRARNYKRLEAHYSWIVEFLISMSVVMEHTT
jgi:hypothetical protein